MLRRCDGGLWRTRCMSGLVMRCKYWHCVECGKFHIHGWTHVQDGTGFDVGLLIIDSDTIMPGNIPAAIYERWMSLYTTELTAQRARLLETHVGPHSGHTMVETDSDVGPHPTLSTNSP